MLILLVLFLGFGDPESQQGPITLPLCWQHQCGLSFYLKLQAISHFHQAAKVGDLATVQALLIKGSR